MSLGVYWLNFNRRVMTQTLDFTEATVLRGSVVNGFSDEAFFRFCQENPALRVERSADNETILIPPSGFDSSAASTAAGGNLYIWQPLTKQRRAVNPSVGYALSDSAVLSPDVSWVSPERLTKVPLAELKVFLSSCLRYFFGL